MTLVLLLGMGGCAHININTVVSSGNPIPIPPFLHIGASKIEWEPGLGYAMGGHSRSGAVAIGRWNKLYARTIAITDSSGESLFIVAIDAWSVSQGLVAAIISKIRGNHPGLPFLRPEQLIVAATHSHHTPGHVASSSAYNAFAQLKMGFDSELFDKLASAIANSVVAAWHARVEAELTLKIGSIQGLVRNRSIAALRKNISMGDVFDPKLAPAVDSRLRSLWATTPSGEIIAVLALVPVHPTAMPASAPIYHPDFFGVASRELESASCYGAGIPVVAIINGAEGDQSPDWQWQGVSETARLGRELADRLCSSTTEEKLDVKVSTTNQQFKLAGARLKNSKKVALYALPSAAQMGGAEDGRTELYKKFNFYEGSKRKIIKLPGQGVKAPVVPLLWPLLGLFAPPPRSAPLILARVSDSLILATLPGEFTTTLGAGVEKAIALKSNTKHVWTIGLANSYLSYFTTKQEYSAQHYEGGSMLYGPLAGQALVEALSDMVDSDESKEYPSRYRVGMLLGKKPKYPTFDRDSCCAPLNGNVCELSKALGVPHIKTSCPDSAIMRHPWEEDIMVEPISGSPWILRVDTR